MIRLSAGNLQNLTPTTRSLRPCPHLSPGSALRRGPKPKRTISRSPGPTSRGRSSQSSKLHLRPRRVSGGPDGSPTRAVGTNSVTGTVQAGPTTLRIRDWRVWILSE